MGDRPHSRVLGRRHAAALIGALAVGVSGLAVATPVTVSATSPASTLVIDGRGNGHGIGMSQWGAYGYAADYGWSAGQILDHYYGGTVAGTTDVTSMTVRLMRLDDQQTAVVNDRALLAVDGVAGGPWGSVVARETAARSYTVWARPDMVCPTAADPLATGWTVVASGVPSVTIRPVTDTSSSADHRDLAAVCESTGIVRSYRGSIRAVNGTAGENRTVNEVPLEHYLRPIVASEMSPSWAAKGSQALQAQAIAARTYSIAEKRYSYAKTCDLVCQFYPGVVTRQGVAGTIKRIEYPSTDAAVAATAGMVRRVGSATGPVAYAMFSSSSGGWTAASTLPFPAVEDLGDATAANPFHRWTVNVPASTVSNAWPAIGQYTGFVVNRRTGQGEWGGRVQSITVTGTAGSVTLSGDTFRRAIGLRSDWFSIRSATPPPTTTAPATTAPPTTTPTTTVPPSTTTTTTVPPSTTTTTTVPSPPSACAGRDAPPVVRTATAAAPAGFTAVTPSRLLDTRNGTGTTVGVVGAGCTLVVRPSVPAGSTAAAVNLIAVGAGGNGFLTAYACGTARPGVSAVQTLQGGTSSAAAFVPLAPDGSFCVFSSVTTHVVLDLFGSFSTSTGSRFEPITTSRRYDSRPTKRLVPAQTVVRVGTRGPGAGPSGSTAASLVVHAVDAAADAHVTVWPCDVPMPAVSSLNVARGSSAANAVDVRVSASGEVCLRATAAMHLVVDLAGWYGPTATTRYVALPQARVADTRTGLMWSGAFGRNVPRRLDITGPAGVPATGVRAVAAQVTAVEGTQAGYVTVHPCLPRTPDVSMLRYQIRRNTAAPVRAAVSTTGDWCFVTNGSAHVVVDVSGWFG
jgi:SpoIID/LytB domain protein